VKKGRNLYGEKVKIGYTNNNIEVLMDHIQVKEIIEMKIVS
jgi:hypothetical protein